MNKSKKQEDPISLRPLDITDLELMYEWRNEPFIVEFSTSRKEVSLEEHCLWFENSLKNKDRMIYIVLHNEKPIGQIRYDKDNDEDIIISAYLSSSYTSKGYGIEAINKGNELIKNVWNNVNIIAQVRVENKRAINGFSHAGFIQTGRKIISNMEHVCFILPHVN